MKVMSNACEKCVNGEWWMLEFIMEKYKGKKEEERKGSIIEKKKKKQIQIHCGWKFDWMEMQGNERIWKQKRPRPKQKEWSENKIQTMRR